MTIGWITLSADAEDPTSPTGIGIYVEAPTLDAVACGFEMVGARPYEMEAAALRAFGDDRFEGVEWWTTESCTLAFLMLDMPHLAQVFANIRSADGLFETFWVLPAEASETPLARSYYDLETYRAIQGTVNLLEGDIVAQMDKLSGGIQ